MSASGPSGSCWLGGTGRPTPVSPNGPSVAAAATFKVAAVAVAAEAAIKARLFMFPPHDPMHGYFRFCELFRCLVPQDPSSPRLPRFGHFFAHWVVPTLFALRVNAGLGSPDQRDQAFANDRFPHRKSRCAYTKTHASLGEENVLPEEEFNSYWVHNRQDGVFSQLVPLRQPMLCSISRTCSVQERSVFRTRHIYVDACNAAERSSLSELPDRIENQIPIWFNQGARPGRYRKASLDAMPATGPALATYGLL